VTRLARRCPDVLAIGVDTSPSGLIQTSRRAALSLRKGGLPNAIFLVGDASEALQALRGRVCELRITLPWGSLLRAVLQGEREFALAVAGSL
jgi:16S rRNA (adenine(1408)-N(1))-methyltransferase